MNQQESKSANPQKTIRANEKPALSPEAMSLMGQGHRLVLLALSQSVSRSHAGWPVPQYHTENRVLAGLAGPGDLAAEALDMDAVEKSLTVRFHAMKRSTKKRAKMTPRSRLDKMMVPSIGMDKAGGADNVEALSVGLAYKMTRRKHVESGQERRAANIAKGRKPKKTFRKTKVTTNKKGLKKRHGKRYGRRLEHKSWVSFQRKRDARDKGRLTESWNRMMLGLEWALRAFFSRVERVPLPAGETLEEWRKPHGLQAAVSYFASLRDEAALRATVSSATAQGVAGDAPSGKKTPRL